MWQCCPGTQGCAGTFLPCPSTALGRQTRSPTPRQRCPSARRWESALRCAAECLLCQGVSRFPPRPQALGRTASMPAPAACRHAFRRPEYALSCRARRWLPRPRWSAAAARSTTQVRRDEGPPSCRVQNCCPCAAQRLGACGPAQPALGAPAALVLRCACRKKGRDAVAWSWAWAAAPSRLPRAQRSTAQCGTAQRAAVLPQLGAGRWWRFWRGARWRSGGGPPPRPSEASRGRKKGGAAQGQGRVCVGLRVSHTMLIGAVIRGRRATVVPLASAWGSLPRASKPTDYLRSGRGTGHSPTGLSTA